MKLAGTLPLPWYGIIASASYQGLGGYGIGDSALPYGSSTGTGYDQPNGPGTCWQVTQSTRYAANCSGPCTPNTLVIPGLTNANLNVPLIAPDTEFTPRINQIDFAVSKRFTFGSVRINPKVDLFNAFNSDDYTSVANTQYGALTYLRPASILQGAHHQARFRHDLVSGSRDAIARRRSRHGGRLCRLPVCARIAAATWRTNPFPGSIGGSCWWRCPSAWR